VLSAWRVTATQQRRATADKWGPLSTISELKNYPEENLLKLNSWGLRKILEKFMDVGN
jgi:hypothetical protein